MVMFLMSPCTVFSYDNIDYLTDSYLGLYGYLLTYSDIYQEGGWPQVPAAGKIKAGCKGENVYKLRQRLYITRDLISIESEDPYLFDSDLTEAVKKFQKRHGLKADGVVGNMTLKELNIPVETRIMQIRLNILELEKSLMKENNQKYILINIPEFKLHFIKNGQELLEMKAIVGKINSPTPIINDKIEYLVFNPYWNIPIKKAVRDILPKIKMDSGYLDRKNIEVYKNWKYSNKIKPENIKWDKYNINNFNLLLRQKPGSINEMGKVKFIFPNNYYVFIHGTPHMDLFDYESRAYSSGCIRIEEPVKLARICLEDNPGWQENKINKVLLNGKNVKVNIMPNLPVNIVYWTTWVDKSGILQFRKDIYNIYNRD